MFGIFKNKDGKEGEQAPLESQSGEITSSHSSQITYSPTLIDELKHDHQRLLGQYMAIQAAFDKGDYNSVSEQLNEFRFELHSHLLTENVRLYIYIGRMMDQDALNTGTVRGFRQEMEGVGKTALRLLKKYEALSIDYELATPFANDFAAIGSVLTERIKKEESILYPLYKASY